MLTNSFTQSLPHRYSLITHITKPNNPFTKTEQSQLVGFKFIQEFISLCELWDSHVLIHGDDEDSQEEFNEMFSSEIEWLVGVLEYIEWETLGD